MIEITLEVNKDFSARDPFLLKLNIIIKSIRHLCESNLIFGWPL